MGAPFTGLVSPCLVCFISSGSEFSSHWSYGGKTKITANGQSILVRTLQSLFLCIYYLSDEDAARFSSGSLRRMRIFLEPLCVLTKDLMRKNISHGFYLSLFGCSEPSPRNTQQDETCILSCLDINVLSKEPKQKQLLAPAGFQFHASGLGFLPILSSPKRPHLWTSSGVLV